MVLPPAAHYCRFVIANMQSIQKSGAVTHESSFLFSKPTNPFNAVTTIRDVCNDKNALLVVRDLNGKALKQISLAAGKGSATINAGELATGTYTYSLIVNGDCTDRKLMVIVK